MGSHPIHPRPSATFPISSWGPESVEEEEQEWDGAEGGGPQLPQLPPFKPPLSQILPLADLGRKKNPWRPEIQEEENLHVSDKIEY